MTPNPPDPDLAQLLEENLALKARVEALEHDVDDRSSALQALSGRLVEAERSAVQVQRLEAALRSCQATAEQERVDLEGQVESLRATSQRLTNELEAVQRTRTFRYTQPARALYVRLRQGGRAPGGD